MIVVAEQVPGLADARVELGAIIAAAAGGGTLPRELALRYNLCRRSLLEHSDRGTVPGFITQCGSLQKFIEFITLFHPDVPVRQAFLAQFFDVPRPATMSSGRYDIFNDPL